MQSSKQLLREARKAACLCLARDRSPRPPFSVDRVACVHRSSSGYRVLNCSKPRASPSSKRLVPGSVRRNNVSVATANGTVTPEWMCDVHRQCGMSDGSVRTVTHDFYLGVPRASRHLSRQDKINLSGYQISRHLSRLIFDMADGPTEKLGIYLKNVRVKCVMGNAKAEAMVCSASDS